MKWYMSNYWFIYIQYSINKQYVLLKASTYFLTHFFKKMSINSKFFFLPQDPWVKTIVGEPWIIFYFWLNGSPNFLPKWQQFWPAPSLSLSEIEISMGSFFGAFMDWDRKRHAQGVVLENERWVGDVKMRTVRDCKGTIAERQNTQ